MRTKLVKIVDTDGNVYEYNGVKRACLECTLPIWYGIYPSRVVPGKYEELFRKIASVTVDDTVRYKIKE
ncbi:hypothetical protein [Clostridium vincentii]|uniref:Uncharacterized protein n=1 Tax=Clostridium vincentii TaxID=52704 RepID=A0A2T0BL66_9CLOT|nr:hypothetical protein [Clostridium vincentii]PRR84522.1 hypothetical protein CLVI_00450 [Clostridium vincentii]